MNTTQSSIGVARPRHEDARLTSGRGHFFADIVLPDTLHVVFVRSQHAHARIRSINTEAARHCPGVVAVIVGEDIKEEISPVPQPTVVPNLPGRFPKHWPLAIDKVTFHGAPIAAIVATNPYLAEDAALLVEVDYETLPYIGTPEAAAQPGAQTVHDEWQDNLSFSMSFTGGATAESISKNVAEVDEIFAKAPIVLKETFRTHRTGVTPLETRGVLASWNPEDGLTCWATTQRPHIERLALADVLGLPLHKVRVIAPRDQGGGFGVKAPFYRETALIAWLAKKLKKPVRWLESREENLMLVGHGRDQTHEISFAATADGRILALRDRITADIGDGCLGIYWGFIMPFLGAVFVPSGYNIVKADIHLDCYFTNKPCITPNRAFGWLPGHFAIERMLDQLAKRVGKDPLQIRLLNLVHELPYTSVTGYYMDGGDFIRVLETLAEKIDYNEFRVKQAEALREGRYLGIGLSSSTSLSGVPSALLVTLENQPGYGAATVRIDPNGRVQILEGDAPTGTGHETMFAQVVSQMLGVDPNDVTFVIGDTSNTPFGCGAVGSRGASYTVSALHNAAKIIRTKMARIFAHDLGLKVQPDDVAFEDGRVYLKNDPGKSMQFSDLANRIIMKPVNLPPGEEGGLEATNYFEADKNMISFSAHACIVEVDPVSGEFKIQRYITCEDAGTVINPLTMEGQVQGGVIQGLSNSIFEEFLFDENGQQMTSTLETYKIAIAPDVPHVETIHVVTPTEHAPLGARGMADGIPGQVPAALVNAICDALAPLGIEITELPVRPSQVWEKLQSCSRRGVAGCAN
ncbi:Xanthine dehydrogenase, molybdenum binding subunit apoprotein [Georgfuchsia toluolica]|uniref:Xanthine dehydrogenase, molybdenum binding subunit apoprotein n=1 Tax=Georgfuchsia toluolica TaxID=424218 RepID=A0A916J5U2_9PROT|nr:xanthine dehydrogenase family protein molybdopterin-binding subunit [Georgfuchsia toluolica]CAG4884789.1 Xanthine dehydrogenase, molybdenum binding subunit apoprotein [Georgfuchsia toluolica]